MKRYKYKAVRQIRRALFHVTGGEAYDMRSVADMVENSRLILGLVIKFKIIKS